MWDPLIAGRYRLRQLLGDGGMGRVWLADDELLRRKVAVKQVTAPPGLTEQQRDRLGELALREARAAAQVDHPHVVKVYARPSATESLSALVSLPPDPPARAGALKALLLGLLEREPRLRPTAAETRAMLSRAAANAGRHGQNAVAAV